MPMKPLPFVGNDLLLKLILLRHGEPDYSNPNVPLTDTGEVEVHRAGALIRESLRGVRHVEVRSSPSPRAIASARIIKKFLSKRSPLTIHEDLNSVRGKDRDQRLHDPEATHLGRQAIQAKFLALGPVDFDREYFENPAWQSGTHPSGNMFESHEETRLRMDDVYRRIANDAERSPTPKAIVIVSHIELLGWRIHQLFGINPSIQIPMRRGEFAELYFMRSHMEYHHEVIARFRGRTIKGLRLSFQDDIEIVSHDSSPVG